MNEARYEEKRNGDSSGNYPDGRFIHSKFPSQGFLNCAFGELCYMCNHAGPSYRWGCTTFAKFLRSRRQDDKPTSNKKALGSTEGKNSSMMGRVRLAKVIEGHSRVVVQNLQRLIIEELTRVRLSAQCCGQHYSSTAAEMHCINK